MRFHKRLIGWLCLLVWLNGVLPDPVSADMMNNMFPDEKEMGIDVPKDQLRYKQYPVENYVWDTNLEWFQMKGIKPETGDPVAITENTAATTILKVSVILTRLSIFVFQFTFNSEFLVRAMDELSDPIVIMKDFFLNNFFNMFVLVLMVFVMMAYARGKKGVAFRHLILAMVFVALLGGLVENISFLTETASQLADSLGAAVVGMVNLAPFTEDEAVEIAKERLVSTANSLWELNVEQPWMFGEFGTLDEIKITNEEREELLSDPDIKVSVGQTWKDILLSYSPGTDERGKLINVLGDFDIHHDPNFSAEFLGQGSTMDRIFISLLSVLLALLTLIFFAILGFFLLAGDLVLIVGAVFSPILVPIPLLAGIGYPMIRRYFGTMLAALALVVAASFYLGIVLLLMYVVALFSFPYIIMQFMNIIILLGAVIFSPKVISAMTPAIIRMSTDVLRSREGQAGQRTAAVYRRVEPQRAEDVTEQNSFGNRSMAETAEDATESNRVSAHRSSTTNRRRNRSSQNRNYRYNQRANEGAESVIENRHTPHKRTTRDRRLMEQREQGEQTTKQQHSEKQIVEEVVQLEKDQRQDVPVKKAMQEALSEQEEDALLEDKTNQIAEDVKELKNKVESQKRMRDANLSKGKEKESTDISSNPEHDKDIKELG